MVTQEYDMIEFNLANVANYAELAMMMAPRPFLVERGHADGVAPDEWVAYEFAKVRRFYATQMKIADRTEIEFFDGPHTPSTEKGPSNSCAATCAGREGKPGVRRARPVRIKLTT